MLHCLNVQLKVNLLHQMFAVNAFLPLIRKGNLKKVVYISSGMADINVIRVCELPSLLGYAVGKASGNIMMAKYAAELKAEGIKTLSLSPGWVETDTGKSNTSVFRTYHILMTWVNHSQGISHFARSIPVHVELLPEA